VLENPWPPAIALLVVGAMIGWTGLREGRTDRIRLALLPIVIGAVALLIGGVVTTSGEHARRITRELVDSVVAGDVVEAEKRFAPGARLHLGATTNVGLDLDYILDQLLKLEQRVTITSNDISSLRIFSESGERATVHLTCRTEVDAGYGPTPSEWVLVVERQADGAWQVTQLTCISINRSPPPSL